MFVFLHIEIRTDFGTPLKKIIHNSAELGIDLNTKDDHGYTAFHLACDRGHANAAKMIMSNSAALKIELNTKSEYADGETPYHSACYRGHTKVVQLMLDQSKILNIDLTAEDDDGNTGTFYAPMSLVNLIKEKMPSLVE